MTHASQLSFSGLYTHAMHHLGSHVLLLRGLIGVIVVLVLVLFLLVLGFLGLLLLLLFALFDFAQFLPLLSKYICLALVVGEDYVIKDGTTLHLPQVETEESEICIFVETVVVFVLRV